MMAWTVSQLVKKAGSIATLIYDTFADADGTIITTHAIAPINTPATSWAQTKQVGTDDFQITSNTARFTTTSSNALFVTCNTGVADVSITADITGRYSAPAGVTPMLTLRLQNVLNYWYIWFNFQAGSTSIQIIERTAGATAVRANSPVTLTSGVTYAATASAIGNDIAGSVNSVSVSYNSASHNTITNHGFGAQTLNSPSAPNNYAAVDNFILEAA